MKEPTRGNGLLENFLARKRADLADSLIDSEQRTGRLLDIGCGSYPLFLQRTDFSEKYGIDPMIEDHQQHGIKLMKLKATDGTSLPFPDGFFSVVTVLAVIEHIEQEKARPLLAEIGRLLVPGGQLILTTPAAWSDRLLRLMAKAHLVSPEEINEHKTVYDRRTLATALAETGFHRADVGYFELGLNMWARAVKSPATGA